MIRWTWREDLELKRRHRGTWREARLRSWRTRRRGLLGCEGGSRNTPGCTSGRGGEKGVSGSVKYNASNLHMSSL